MARSVAKITVDILRDPDWVSLSAGAQRLYALVILPQPRLALCGYLDTISPSRWANLADDTTADDLQAALDELERNEYVVIDHDTEELVVRSFVKNDLDASRLSANVCKGFWAAWKSISSLDLRRTVVANCPDEHWEKLAKHAPTDALQMRRSRPFERERPTPSEWEGQPPSAGEQAPPSPSTVTSHQSPVDGQQQPLDTPSPDTPTEPSAAAGPQVAAADPEQTIREALAYLVDRAVARNPPRTNPTGHRKAIAEGIRTDHLKRARDYLRAWPEADASELADHLEPSATGTTRPPDPVALTAEAAAAEMERNAARTAGDGCETCHGAYWLGPDLLDDRTWGPVTPCPTCNPEAQTA